MAFGPILYFLKLTRFSEKVGFTWGRPWVAWSERRFMASHEEIAEQEGSRPGAINAIVSDDAGIGKYRRLYSNVMKAERERETV